MGSEQPDQCGCGSVEWSCGELRFAGFRTCSLNLQTRLILYCLAALLAHIAPGYIASSTLDAAVAARSAFQLHITLINSAAALTSGVAGQVVVG